MPKDLEQIAKNIRKWSLIAIHAAKSGHPGGCLSVADILAYLYFEEAKENDRIILSKGHACPALYATFAELGYVKHEELSNLRKLGSRLQGHPSVKDLPYVETSTGSLGQGFSVAVGMAMGLKYLESDARVFCILGDGELQEGIVWEAAMCAAHYKLDNLWAIVDYNGCQSDDWNKNVMSLDPLNNKFEAFGWNTVSVYGHDLSKKFGLGFATNYPFHNEKPNIVFAATTKGKGVSFMEQDPLKWHGSVVLTDEQLETALKELE